MTILCKSTKIEPDKLKKKIKKMYRNFGINVSELTDDEVERIYKYYINNEIQFKKDFADAEKHEDKYSDEEVV